MTGREFRTGSSNPGRPPGCNEAEPQVDARESSLRLNQLSAEFRGSGNSARVLHGVSLSVETGKTLCLVGESGSGKSVTAMSIARLNPASARYVEGSEIWLGDTNILALTEAEMRLLRRRDIGVVFQDPGRALNPVMPIGRQIIEGIGGTQRRAGDARSIARAIELLELVGISNPRKRLGQYPHEFSGGMKQRVVIAIALANEPRLLIADEPTTALDVTIQAQILDLFRTIQREFKTTLIFITHDLAVVSEIADDVAVMYAGRVIETGPVGTILGRPGHPYTVGLLGSLPGAARGGDLIAIPGQPASATRPPPGCAFHPRCRVTRGRKECVDVLPDLVPVGEHAIACHFPAEARDQMRDGAGE